MKRIYLHFLELWGYIVWFATRPLCFSEKFIEKYVLSRTKFVIMLCHVDRYLVTDKLEGVILLLADCMYALLGPENGGSNLIRNVSNCLPNVPQNILAHMNVSGHLCKILVFCTDFKLLWFQRKKIYNCLLCGS
jgi:hypothetical protein